MKHAAALFEVIHQPTVRPRRSALDGLLGWLRPRRGAMSRPTGLSSPVVSPPAAAPPAAPAMVPAPAAAPVEAPVIRSAPTVPSGRAEGVSVAVDPSRHEVSLRFSYVSAAICAVAVVVLLGLAYLFGRQSLGSPRPVLAQEPVRELRNKAAAPQVLKLSPSETPGGGDEMRVAPPTTRGATPRFNEPAPPNNFVVDDPRRQAGLNYVVIQSYPSQQMADEVVQLLARNGVSATVERGLKGWSRSWYMVVGTRGFARISAAEYKAYITQLKTISDKNLHQRSFKAFMPQAYKWGQ